MRDVREHSAGARGPLRAVAGSQKPAKPGGNEKNGVRPGDMNMSDAGMNRQHERYVALAAPRSTSSGALLLPLQAARPALEYRNFGTLQNRAKVVDSLPGSLSGMARCRHNLAPQAKRSRRLSFNTDGTMRPLSSPCVGDRTLKRLEGLGLLDLKPSPVDPYPNRGWSPVAAVVLKASARVCDALLGVELSAS